MALEVDDHENRLFGEEFAFETLGAASVEDHCLALRGEVQGLRTVIETRRQRRASLNGNQTNARTSHDLADTTQLQARQVLEQQIVRAETVQDFEKRLADMQVQLLAKQHEFEQYRQAMEHDLKQQLRAAQPHLVSQLVDKSGAMSVETKTSFLESLHGQAELYQLQQENVAFKQTILKLQTLYDMQRQIRAIESEKEKAVQKAQRSRVAQLVNENAELQQRICQLETEVIKVSQERTLYQTKYIELQKQNEQAAQRRREAKVRALSAPYRRRLDGIESPRDDGTPNDYEQQQETFEKMHEIHIRSPRRDNSQTIKSPDTVQREEQHLQKATRHFQNEIKRLQQQLGKEIKLKGHLMTQVTQLKAVTMGENNEQNDSLDPNDPPGPSVSKTRIISASPRVGAASASVCSPRKVPVMVVAPRRPSTSYSSCVNRRPLSSTSHPEAPSPCHHPSDDPAPTPSRSIPPRSASVSGSSTRKFEVLQRESPVVKVGGIAGVQNALSVRERLPYR